MTYIVGWCKFFNVCLNKLVLGLWQIDLPLVWTLKLCKFMECHGLGLAVKQLESLSELCPCLYVNLEWLIGVKRLWDTDLLASLDFARKEHCSFSSFLLFFSCRIHHASFFQPSGCASPWCEKPKKQPMGAKDSRVVPSSGQEFPGISLGSYLSCNL